MSASLLSDATRTALADLQERVRQIEGVRSTSEQPSVSTGSSPLDALLPAGGLQRGTLWECFPGLQSACGGGTGTLTMLLAKALAADGGAVVVVDRDKTFSPPAAVALGIPWEQLLIVQPHNAQEELWAIDQSLRCAGVAAVWAPLKKIGDHDFRRLQLAAESGEVVGLLLRDTPWRKEPSWAHVQIAVSSLASGEHQFSKSSRHLQVAVIRVRGAKLNASSKRAIVSIDEVTGQFSQKNVSHPTSDHVARRLYPFPPVANPAADRTTA